MAAETVHQLLRRYNLHPTKGLGQNFLVDEHAQKKVAAAAEIGPGDTVLEVGAGLGNLTRHLADAAERVVAVELDANLIPVLSDVLREVHNVEIIQGDILEVDLGEVFPEPGYLVVANIPYYITAAILRHLLEAPQSPARLVLTVQKEVAERICAPPGKLSLLALSVQVYGQPEIVGKIPAGAFYPAPKVDSAIVRVDLYQEPRVPRESLDAFFRLTKAGFSQKRKTLRNALSGGLGLPKPQVEAALQQAGIDPMRRAQTLTLDEWGKLVQASR